MHARLLTPNLFRSKLDLPPLPQAGGRVMRCGCTVHRPEPLPLSLSWTLALTASCLLVALAGLAAPVARPLLLLQSGTGQEEDTAGELALLDMSGPMMEVALETMTEEQIPEETHITEPEMVAEMPPEVLDLPEIVQEMKIEDVFEVPAAPAIESVLTPVTPRPAPTPAPRPQIARPAAPSSSGGTAAASSSSGAGGTGGSAAGSVRGTFPSPPYPATARSRGMQGTVYLSIRVGTDGRPSGVEVARSCGYSDLDRHASEWVRRNWRWPAGQTGNYRQSVVFRLR